MEPNAAEPVFHAVTSPQSRTSSSCLGSSRSTHPSRRQKSPTRGGRGRERGRGRAGRGRRRRGEATQDPLKLYVRQIGDGRLLDGRRGARARAAQGRGRRGGQAEADRVESPARDVDHAQLHEGRRAAPRPDPGGQPRPDPRGREVRLHDGLQALDVRDVVDPPGGHPRARRAGSDDPPAGPRRRAGAPRHARPPRPRPEAEPRPDHRRDRGREPASRPSASRSCSSSSRIRSASRRPSATARASTAT